MEQSKKRLISNTIYMYILSFAKLVIPLISLPYLTKVLSVDSIGGVSFVKSFVAYAQVFVDFGFIISATKDIVEVVRNKGEINRKIGDILYAQLLLCILAFVFVLICIFSINALDGYELYAILSIVPVFLSVFLFEYVFRAYEKMEKIALRFVVMKVIALLLTLTFVKSDKQIILIPIFDIISSLVAIILVVFQLKELNVKVKLNFFRIKESLKCIAKSFVCFFANFMSTAFSLLNTILIGLILTKKDVAYWTVAFQFMSAINAMYTPIISSVHPIMLKEKNLKLIHQILAIFVPIIMVGCVAVYFLSDWFVTLVFGNAYIFSGTIIRFIIPVIIASFFALVYGWPCFSAINREKQNTIITIIGAVVHVLGIVVLLLFNCFDLISLSVVRGFVEIVIALLRMIIVYRNKKFFVVKAKDS